MVSPLAGSGQFRAASSRGEGARTIRVLHALHSPLLASFDAASSVEDSGPGSFSPSALGNS
jgi:hypothetical protein